MESSRFAQLCARHRIALVCLLAVVTVITAEGARWARAKRAAATPATIGIVKDGAARLTEISNSLIPMPHDVPSAHASALTTLPGDRMLAFWWAGDRESAPNVKVYAARWQDGKWGQPWEVASRASLAQALGFGVRRIGNPVAWTAHDGRIHLYVVATGLGGWAASRLVHLVSSDQGASFVVRRLLPMSPLFNTSVLVRTSPVGLIDGGWWLPVYFEIGIKYPMLMSFDADGDPSWVARIGRRISTLQPTVVPVSATEIRAWMRDASDEQRVQQAYSRDGGASWEDLPALDLPNHGTSLAALRLRNGEFLMLHNHVVEGGSSRSMLRLSLSKDGRTWRPLADIASGDAGDEFSYPTMQQVGNELHVAYTYQRRAIAHHRYRITIGDKT
jgi:predicted neuraminidase